MSKKIFLLSLGCAKNRVDSERMAYELEQRGYELTSDPNRADFGVINTCGFIRPAAEESIESILSLLELKQEGHLSKVAVVGCLLNRYQDDLKKELPEVDVWVECEDISALLHGLGEKETHIQCLGRALLPNGKTHSRYLKIIEGCDNRCAYCTIPSIRGHAKSLSVDFLVAEAMNLVAAGAKELCLVGQDLTAYGFDSYGKAMLPELLDALESSLPKELWIRLLYLHPNRVDQKLLERVASGKQILPYLDIPIQHASQNVLHAMNRGITVEKLKDIFLTARSIRPDFALRTTCMVGFPGETRQDFAQLLSFLEAVHFDRVGAFSFFPEEGTPAAAMSSQVTERTKKNRLNKLMELQQDISFMRQRLFEGQVLDTLIDSIHEGVGEGRSYREAPDVDGLIEVSGIRKEVSCGDIIPVRIQEALEYDLIGQEVLL